MPNNFFSVDSRFPNIENKTQDEINAELVNYLYMLLEQLRYTMGNLGVGNFNESELNDIAGMISSPIYAKIEDAEGNITQLSVTAEGLTSRVENAEGDISILTQTAEGLVSRVQNAEGDISTLTQTAEGLVSRVQNAEGDISVLSQTAESLSSRISDNAGNISQLTQTAESLSSRISDNAGNISQLTQTAESLSSRISDNAGNISQLTQTAEGLESRVQSAEGDISTLSQTASGLLTRVSNAEGNISTLSQTASGLSTRVSNVEGDVSTLEQTATSISARVGQVEVDITNLGVAVSGAVTVQSLENANVNTVINNATVTTTSAVGRYTSLTSGQINFGLTGGNTASIYGTEQGLWLSAYAGLFSDSSYASLVAVNNFAISGSAVTITATAGYVNVITDYGMILNGEYHFLHTGNMKNYILNNAADIRSLLGL